MFAKALLAIHQRICRVALLALARSFVRDELEVSFNGRTQRACRRKGTSSARVPALRAQIEITDMRAWPLVLLGGSAGLGEAWSKGYWESADLTAAIRVIARATSVADGPRSLLQKVAGQITDRFRRLRPLFNDFFGIFFFVGNDNIGLQQTYFFEMYFFSAANTLFSGFEMKRMYAKFGNTNNAFL